VDVAKMHLFDAESERLIEVAA
ncbi:MAG: hypothetical protein K0S21_2927, partial [Rhizobiaceae bacterium]|nr:hypothetical protein [Rhizobiaceae bacterium]